MHLSLSIFTPKRRGTPEGDTYTPATPIVCLLQSYCKVFPSSKDHSLHLHLHIHLTLHIIFNSISFILMQYKHPQFPLTCQANIPITATAASQSQSTPQPQTVAKQGLTCWPIRADVCEGPIQPQFKRPESFSSVTFEAPPWEGEQSNTGRQALYSTQLMREGCCCCCGPTAGPLLHSGDLQS